MVQEWQSIISEKGDIGVVGGCGKIEGVSEEGREEVRRMAG